MVQYIFVPLPLHPVLGIVLSIGAAAIGVAIPLVVYEIYKKIKS